MSPPWTDTQQWYGAIQECCPNLDDEIVSYLSMMAIDEPTLRQTAASLTEAFVDYDAATDSTDATRLCQRVFDRLGIKQVFSVCFFLCFADNAHSSLIHCLTCRMVMISARRTTTL